MTLPQGWAVEEDTEEPTALPAGWTVEGEEEAPKQQGYRDPVSEELRRLGVEPDFSEELERAAGYGAARETINLPAGLASGISTSFSENVPGLGLKEDEGIAGKIIGSVLPIGASLKF